MIYLETTSMKRNPLTIFFFYFLFAGLLSCHTSYQANDLQYTNYRLNASLPADSGLVKFLKPYHDEVGKTMNDIVGVVDVTLDKAAPESALGNFMADAFLTMTREKYNMKVDGAMMNYGGIRLTQLPAGEVTTGKIFELMPFDNLLILQKLSGIQLQQLLDLTAARGGWPVAGITMEIKDKKAVNVRVGGQPLDPSATYTIANSDFVANGGDDAAMLKNVPQITNGYLMRDALFDYIKKLKASGKNISAQVENRVRYAQ